MKHLLCMLAYERLPRQMNHDVMGMDLLSFYLNQNRHTHTPDLRVYGVEPWSPCHHIALL